MMEQDIVERLRKREYFTDDLIRATSESDADLIDKYRAERREAANEIEKLREELFVCSSMLEGFGR